MDARFEPSAAEFAERLSRCGARLGDASLDCLVVFPGPAFRYLTGLAFARERYRVVVAVVHRDGTVDLGGPAFEEQKLSDAPVAARLTLWSDDEDQHGIIAGWIRERHGGGAAVGLEPTTDAYHGSALAERLPGARIGDAGRLSEALRAIKSSAEIACLREAARRTRARMCRVPDQLETGMTERQLAGLFGPGAMVQFGLTTSLPNAGAGSRPLAPSDVVVIDAGDRVAGYRSDLTRTFLFGRPSDRMKEVYAVVNEAELAAIDAARPGTPAVEVDRAARRVIDGAGFGHGYLHCAGHGIGLAFHEIPICSGTSEDVLEPGMVHTVEPGVYLPGEFGVRLEDDLLITDDGCELLCERGPLYLDH
jgi:Xaa-Pro dipeptidase